MTYLLWNRKEVLQLSQESKSHSHARNKLYIKKHTAGKGSCSVSPRAHSANLWGSHFLRFPPSPPRSLNAHLTGLIWEAGPPPRARETLSHRKWVPRFMGHGRQLLGPSRSVNGGLIPERALRESTQPSPPAFPSTCPPASTRSPSGRTC